MQPVFMPIFMVMTGAMMIFDQGSSMAVYPIVKRETAEIGADLTLTLPDETDWPSLLYPAPKIMTILGQIMVLSRQGADFALMEDKSKKLDFIKHPESFQATIAQLIHAALDAFLLAEGNMEKISEFLKTIPSNIEMAVDYIKEMEPQSLKAMLETPLQSINSTSKQCVELAAATNQEFKRVLGLINEIIEVGRLKEGQARQEEADKEVQANLTEQARADAERQHKEYEKLVNDSRDQLAEAQKACDKAIQNLPDSWTVLGQDLLKTVVNAFSDIGKGFAEAYSGRAMMKMMGGLGGAIGGLAGSGQQAGLGVGKPGHNLAGGAISSQCASIGKRETNSDDSDDEETADADSQDDSEDSSESSDDETYDTDSEDDASNEDSLDIGGQCDTGEYDGTFGEFLTKCNNVLSAITQIKFKKQTLEDSGETLEAAQGLVKQSRTVFSQCEKGLNRFPSGGVKKKGKDLTKQAAQILKTFDKTSTTQYKTLQQEIAKKNKEIDDIIIKLASGSNQPTGNQQAQAQLTKEQAQFQFAQQKLEMHEKSYKENVQNLRENDRELSKLTHEIAKLTVTINNLKSIIEVLKKCLAHLATLQEHWTQLVQFFQHIDAQIQAKMGKDQTLDVFVNMSITVQGQIEKSSLLPTKREIFLRHLIKQQNEIKFSFAYLYTMTKTYFNISRLYLIPSVSKLNGLVEKTEENKATDELLKELADKADNDTKGIEDVVRKQVDDYHEKIQKEIERLKIEQQEKAKQEKKKEKETLELEDKSSEKSEETDDNDENDDAEKEKGE